MRIRGAVFLLAADRQQLENSAKTAFGANLDFEEYYRKFVHREITLPEISDENYQNLASKYVNYYLERKGSRICHVNFDESRIENISELVGALKLTPRQIQEVFRTLGHIFETTEEHKGRLRWCLAVGSIMMSVLKIGNPRIFHLLGTQQLQPRESLDFLNNLRNLKYVDWWFTLCLTGGGLKVETDETDEDIMKKVGLLKKNDELASNWHQWQDGWGHRNSSKFVEIYEKIEQLSQWG